MSGASIMAIDSISPVPDLSVLELALVICCVRRPGTDPARVAAEIGRWFNICLDADGIAAPIRRLSHRQWLSQDGGGLHVIEEAGNQAEFAAHGVIRLLFRDRYFFDVGKLLDVRIVKEDPSHED